MNTNTSILMYGNMICFIMTLIFHPVDFFDASYIEFLSFGTIQYLPVNPPTARAGNVKGGKAHKK